MDQEIINAINNALKPNLQPQTPTKLSPRFKSLALECGFEFWQDESWGPGQGNIDWSCDYTSEFEKYSRELVEWTCHMFKAEVNSGKNLDAAANTTYKHLVL